jgi:hypothetical protein
LEAGLAFLELTCLDEWKKNAALGGFIQADLATMEYGLGGHEEYNIGKVFCSWVVGKLVIND